MTHEVAHRSPALWRDNAYERPCHHCHGIVLAEQGQAFLLWDEYKQRNTWRAAHDSCAYLIKAGEKPAEQQTGSVAAKAVTETKDAEAEMERLLTAPAFAMPEAEAMEQHMAEVLAEMVKTITAEVADCFTAVVPGMVAEGIREARPLAISVNDAPAVTVERSHKALPDVLLMVAAGASPFLVGPAGSGKTTLAEQVATCLNRPFYMASRVTSEYKLVGFTDANGHVVRTQFREAYEHGGVFLFDEVDASDADALTAFNAALAGKQADFPDGMVQRHPDFCAIAAGNTFGRGADRQYVGRNQLDAATLDRFQVYEVDYDEQLEVELCGNAEWAAYVQKVRAAIEAEKVRHVVSPRASIAGAKLLAAGMDRVKVAEACVWKGLDAAQRARVTARMGGQ